MNFPANPGKRMNGNGSSVAASNLIVVSNRLPFVLIRDEETGELSRKSSAGGLVTAVAPVVVRSGGKKERVAK